MDLWILNSSFTQVGVLDDYGSLIWSKRYNEIGDCEIYIGANERTINLLQKGYYITRSDDDMICRIETVEIDTDTEQGNHLIVTGYDCRKILNQRIVWTQTNFTGTAENFIRKIITDNVINPSLTRRKISNFRLGTSKGFTDAIEIQSTYDYLFDKIQELCETFGYGSTLEFDGTNFTFNLYKGVDRSIDQTDNEVVIFSPEFENIIKTSYKMDASAFKNSALVAGEGEGTERVQKEISGGSGIDRFELYVDARDISSKTEEEVQLTDAEYKALLNERGQEKLSEVKTLLTFDGEVEPNYSYKYGEDYFLGDIVTVRNEYGIEANARVIEVIESDSDDGYSIIPTFEYIEVSEPVVMLTALATEDNEPLATEDNEILAPEQSFMTFNAAPSSGSVEIDTVKISQLPASTDIYEGCYLPIVTNGETKKLTYELLRTRLATDLEVEAISNATIDAICV